MKKVKKLFIIFTLLVIKFNINYATVTGNYTVSKTKSNGKTLFLLIGLVLIGMVLFLGYKMDKFEESSNRKKKYKKIEEKKDSIKYNISNLSSKIIDKKEEFVSKINNFKNKEETETIKTNQSRDIIEYDEDDYTENNIETDDNSNYSNNEEKDEEPKIQSYELDVISNIFNKKMNNDINKDDEINLKVKGYDFDINDDIELLDIEESIKEANIKKFTRKKEKKAKNPLKRYTRKIVKENEQEETDIKPKNKTKRYTRKIIKDENTNSNDYFVTSKNDITVNTEDDEKTDDIDFMNKIIDLGILNDINEKELDKNNISDKEELVNESHENNVIKKSGRGRKPKSSKLEKDDIKENKNNTKEKNDKKTKTKKEEKSKTKKTEKKETKKVKTTETKRGRKPKVITEEEELRQVVEMLPKSRRGRKPKR